jgi:hypothetical protein
MPRPEPGELGLKGQGVEAVVHKDINRLADKFEDLLTQRASLSEQIGDTETALMEKMKEKGLEKYRYRDQMVTFKPGKDHIKIKTVKADSGKSNGAVETEKERE